MALFAAGCGARTGLYIPPPAPPPPECYVTSDCEGAEDLCVPVVCQPLEAGGGGGGAAGAGGAGGLGGTGGTAGAGGTPQALVGGTCVKLEPVDCDDDDPCTKDRCEPWSGQCLYDLATLDLDGDGFRGPRPGTKPGDPDACGDDCDDANANAFPGGTEICDGVDNDCNGIVDDNAEYLPGSVTVKVSDGPIDPAGPGGLGYTEDGKYFALYTGTDGGFRMYKRRVGDAADLLTQQDLYRDESLTGDAYGGPMIWVGDRYGVLWQDRTPGDYEIYFSLADQEGSIAFPGPVRLSFASGFSINPSLSWNGTEFIAVWQDERTGIFELFAQKLDVDAKPIGDNIQLTDQDSGFGNEAPSVAAGVQTIGVAWNIGDATTHFIRFRTFDLELKPVGQTLSLTDGLTAAVYPVVVWNKDRYVVAWFDKTASPAAIYAATLDEEGNLLAGPQPVTSPGSAHSRYPNLRPLGDRTLLVYSDDRDGNDGYELYSMIFDNDLSPLTPELRVTNAPRDSIYPTVAFGKEGAVGVLFRDDRENGQPHVYFTQLGCSAGGPP